MQFHVKMAYKTKLLNKAEEQKQNTTLFRLQNIFTWMWSPVDSFPKLHNYTSAIELLFILGFSCGKTASKSQCAYIQVCVYHALWAELVGNQSTILRETNLGWFQKVKKCHFNHSKCSKFSFLGKLQIWNVTISKNSKFTALIIVKIADFDTLNDPFYMNSILRVINDIRKFHPWKLAQFHDNFCCYPFTKNIFT